jgi:hypothetical protein
MITETEFSAELARVKAKTLSGSGQEAGLGRVTGLRHFPYLGVVRLAGLGWFTTRVIGLRQFPYPGRSG